jgi:hypothetical protein
VSFTVLLITVFLICYLQRFFLGILMAQSILFVTIMRMNTPRSILTLSNLKWCLKTTQESPACLGGSRAAGLFFCDGRSGGNGGDDICDGNDGR